jgi:hypothetical protein
MFSMKLIDAAMQKRALLGWMEELSIRSKLRE